MSPVIPFHYPDGHLGHLSPDQRQSFSDFKQLCVDKGIYRPATTDIPPSHDDATLLRYLRARKFQIQPAYEQFASTEKWRKENRLVELFETIDVDEYEETRRLYPQWTGRRDKRGFPLYVFEVAPLDVKGVADYERAKSLKGADTDDRPAPPKMLRLFALYESLTRFVAPFCTASRRPNPETPITQGNNIIDVSSVSLRQFWALRNHLQDSSQLATAHYPETLDKIFIIGAPGFFSTIWSWVKRWFDPIVVAKMHICGPNDVLSTLSEYIDPQHIPVKYGGQLQWSFGDLPSLDPVMLEHLQWAEGAERAKEGRSWPIGPVKWDVAEDGRMVAVAVGTKDGKGRKERVVVVDRKYEEVFYPVDSDPTAGIVREGQ
ncbi:hypothetical protein M231_03990 [Tremella mesenterica]|uniref:CRAL-TRIO domain-containing protein n=1 Tax=Tremella mesenterica TaxID=5217 RepID=A0A4Q1BLX1_TREME|nr:hypothetical protein M231_03990 [Tremella mesenterica]